MNTVTPVVAMRLEAWALGLPALRCGIGPRRAYLETSRALRGGSIDAVLDVGIAGGLEAGLRPGQLVLVDGWVDGPAADPQLAGRIADQLTAAGVRFVRGQALTVARPLIRPGDKERAQRRTSASICEMEGCAVAEACAEVGVPCAALRAVADDRDTVLRRPPRMLVQLVAGLLGLRRAGPALGRLGIRTPPLS